MKKLSWANLLLILAMIWPLGGGYAQQEDPGGPVYVVQVGDTLSSIAQQFGVSLDELARANDISNPNQISEGAQLVIPGLEGVQGFLTSRTVPLGESLKSLSRRFQIAESMLARLNHLTSPAELYAGSALVIPVQEGTAPGLRRTLLAEGFSLLEMAARMDVSPWNLAQANGLRNQWSAIAGGVLYALGDYPAGPGALPGEISAIEVNSLPFLQGKTWVIRLIGSEGLRLVGKLMESEFTFFEGEPGSYVALQGVHAMAEPGLYPLTLQGALADGASFSFSQRVEVQGVRYPFDRPLDVDPATTDPAVTGPEDALWRDLTRSATPEKLWSGVFGFPSPLPAAYCLETNDCWSSRFGNRRSYNGSPYIYFHSGLDIVGKPGTEIFAPAQGIVVFTGELTVRGNATMIDHGWGVYTGYMHQSEILVEVGDRVETGQVIGLVGRTGRVEGPHLHWEVWVGGVQVDPLDWLLGEYPD